MRILIDAMGGDHAPKAPVQGALEAVKLWNANVVLVGREEEIRAAAKEAGYETLPQGLEIVHAPDVVDMNDDPANVCRKKKESSMVVGLRMLSEDQADAMISAGSTGALLNGATLIVKRVKGIRRAAMGPAMPNKVGGKTVLCDCGANAECTPEFLLQFGIVGSLFAKKNLGIANPRVGLLNIGTEDTKGTPLQKEAYALLTDAHNKGLINFIGNIEARDTLLGEVDVVVCDGFSGNVLLKSIEGTAQFMGSLMKHKIFKRNFLSKIGYLFCKPGVDEVMKMMDYRENGGTQFLGVKKPVIKAHGSSDALAFRNAVRQAMEAAKNNISEELEQSLQKLNALKETSND
jgi:glycerol-3-phosphate acyltransferase PlsX